EHFHMAGDTNNNHATTLQAAVQEIQRLQRQMASFEADKAQERERARLAAQEEEGIAVVDSQPLAQALWETQVLDGFKAPHLPSFDGNTDPVEH
ncbi:hypothetical protein A2U01_0076642, partial [Trifolium medium]|nr:hypothetical protein [Trifolium medium]